jgi:hypothetical protein
VEEEMLQDALPKSAFQVTTSLSETTATAI